MDEYSSYVELHSLPPPPKLVLIENPLPRPQVIYHWFPFLCIWIWTRSSWFSIASICCLIHFWIFCHCRKNCRVRNSLAPFLICDSFPVSSKISRLFELIHCGLWGPYSVPSYCGVVYFLTIVDDYSRGVWVNLLQNETEVYHYFTSFFAMISCQFDTTI